LFGLFILKLFCFRFERTKVTIFNGKRKVNGEKFTAKLKYLHGHFGKCLLLDAYYPCNNGAGAQEKTEKRRYKMAIDKFVESLPISSRK
jgi:hypothetical protein